jgi:hypothetical protein
MEVWVGWQIQAGAAASDVIIKDCHRMKLQNINPQTCGP